MILLSPPWLSRPRKPHQQDNDQVLLSRIGRPHFERDEGLLMETDISHITINTPMIKEAHATLTQWILCGFTGGLMVGDARLGKTQAIRSFSDFSSDHNGDPIPIFRVSYGLRDKNTIRSVYDRIARSLEKQVRRSMSADDLLSDLLMHFADAAIANHNRKIVLIIDEAQELVVEQLFAFVELFNELEELGVRLSVFFVANKDRFTPLAKQLLEDKNRFIRERFFNYIYVFHGIRTLDELRACLSYYDSHTLDELDQQTWMQYYCPDAVASGFRIVDIADMLWEFWNTDYANRFGYESWGMTYFNRTLSIVLRDYFPQYWSANPNVISEILEKSLEAAGNEPTLTTVFSNVR